MPLCRAAVWLLLTGLAAFAELRVGRAGADDPGVKALVLDDGQTRAFNNRCRDIRPTNIILRPSGCRRSVNSRAMATWSNCGNGRSI